MRTSLAKAPRSSDPTFYLVDDDMGESTLHREIGDLLRALLARFLTQQGVTARAAADQFIYWVQGRGDISVCPDVYVLPGVDPNLHYDCWKTWEHGGVVPSLVVEIVSKDRKKDYEEALVSYDALGVREVIVFDPSPSVGRKNSRRVRFQIFRRVRGRGLTRVEVTNDDRVKSKVLGCWIRMVDTEEGLRLRLATGAHGDELFPTAEEAERRARLEAEAARAEAERSAREAQAEIAHLRAALASRPAARRRRS